MTRRHDSKISAIFWGFLYMFPFILFLFAFLAYFQPFTDNALSLDILGFSSWFLEFSAYIELPTIISYPFLSFLNLFLDDFSSLHILGAAFAQFLFNLLIYYIFVHIVRLAVDVILFIPHLFHSWISKFDRKVE